MPVTDEATAEVFDEIETIYFQNKDFDAISHELSVSFLIILLEKFAFKHKNKSNIYCFLKFRVYF